MPFWLTLFFSFQDNCLLYLRIPIYVNEWHIINLQWDLGFFASLLFVLLCCTLLCSCVLCLWFFEFGVICCVLFWEGSPHLWAIVWRMTLNHFEYFRVIHVFPWAAIWLVRGRDTKFVENSFCASNEKKQKDSRDWARVRQSLRICWFLLKEMRCLKKSGFVIKMDTAGFKPSIRYFLWVWSSSDVSNALKTWKMMICSPCWPSLGTLELYQKVYFLSLQLCVPLSNSSLHLWFCKEKRSEKSKKLFLITHQTEHKQSNHCLPEDQWFSEISWTLSIVVSKLFCDILKKLSFSQRNNVHHLTNLPFSLNCLLNKLWVLISTTCKRTALLKIHLQFLSKGFRKARLSYSWLTVHSKIGKQQWIAAVVEEMKKTVFVMHKTYKNNR